MLVFSASSVIFQISKMMWLQLYIISRNATSVLDLIWLRLSRRYNLCWWIGLIKKELLNLSTVWTCYTVAYSHIRRICSKDIDVLPYRLTSALCLQA
jgi:hypothetical protein